MVFPPKTVGKPSRTIEMKMSRKKIPYVSTDNSRILVDTQTPSLQKYNQSIRNSKFNLIKKFNCQRISILTQVVIFYLLFSTVCGNLSKKDHQSRSSSYSAEENNQVLVNKICFYRTINTAMSSVNSSNETVLMREEVHSAGETSPPGNHASTKVIEHHEPNQFLPSHQGTDNW